MNKKTALPITGIVLIALSVTCRAQDIKAAHAIVTGPENQLAEFHKNLVGYLWTDLDSAAITCERPSNPTKTCEQLSRNGSAIETLDYVFLRDYERLLALIMAWGKVQTAQPNKAFKITFDGDVTAANCGAPLPQPCKPAPFCRQTPGCDETIGYPCTKCDGAPPF
jgi:hypothetical protein